MTSFVPQVATEYSSVCSSWCVLLITTIIIMGYTPTPYQPPGATWQRRTARLTLAGPLALVRSCGRVSDSPSQPFKSLPKPLILYHVNNIKPYYDKIIFITLYLDI